MTTIPAEVISACQAEFAASAAFRFKDDASIIAIIESDEYLKEKLLEYAGCDGTGLDTYERHYLFDAFTAKHIDGLDHWPMLGFRQGENDDKVFLDGIKKLHDDGMIVVV